MKEDFLEKIRPVKQAEVLKLKQARNSFMELFKDKEKLVFLGEIKPKSPSFSEARNVNFITQAKTYEEGGIDGLSVLTDTQFFGGNFQLLQEMKRNTRLPLLCKDFVLDKSQIVLAAKFGADAILLIVDFLPFPQLMELYAFALDLQLQPVLEVQSERELESVLKLKPKIIGVNSRNLRSLEIDKARALAVIQQIPDEVLSIFFSGISNRENVELAKQAGARGVLVGSALMNSENVAQKIKELKGKI